MSSNSSGNASAGYAPSEEKRLLAGMVYLTGNLFGMTGNLLVFGWRSFSFLVQFSDPLIAAVLTLRRPQFASFTFYHLVFSLAVGDSLYLLVNLLKQVPETFNGELPLFR